MDRFLVDLTSTPGNADIIPARSRAPLSACGSAAGRQRMRAAGTVSRRAARTIVAEAYPFVVEWVLSLRHSGAVWLTLERFMHHIAGRSLSTVSPENLSEYKEMLIADGAARGIDPGGFATKEVIVVKRLFKLAYEAGVIRSNPGAGLVARAVYRGRIAPKPRTLAKPSHRSPLWNDPNFSARFDDALMNFRGR